MPREILSSASLPASAAGTLHHSSLVILALLVGFGVLHSGGASLRVWGEERIGARAWRLLFAAVSIPAAVVVIGYFLAHRYDGVRLWNLQDQPWIVPLVWVGTAISFLFLYPATYNLREIPALQRPQVRLYATGIIRISRHPQAVGQVLWCATHLLWIGSSFMVVTCLGLIGHHMFAIWNGDRRLRNRFGPAFEELRASTSVIPFRAVLDGRQTLVASEFLRPAQLGIAIAVGVFWWAHRFIGLGAIAFSRTALAHWLG
ncbi:MAG: NnrU family protein [Cyanobium sp.]